METPSQQAQLAVLIDADNANAKRIDNLLAEVAKYGRATTKRAYGDWTNTHLGSWKQTLARHAIQPMQQFSNTRGKNSTDSALIIDAMDLLYTERFDGFCIVSSDSDFTRLASRIREAGLTVYGFGERKTPQPFVRACDRFIYVEVLGQESADDDAPVADAPPPPAAGTDRGRHAAGQHGRRQGGGNAAAGGNGAGGRPAPTPAPAQVAAKAGDAGDDSRPTPSRGGTVDDPALLVPLRAAVADAADEDGWAGLGAVGSLIGKRMPEFDPRNWGRKKLSDLFLAIPIFEVDERGEPGRSRQLFVREKRDGLDQPAMTAVDVAAPAPVGTDSAPAAQPSIADDRPRQPERGEPRQGGQRPPQPNNPPPQSRPAQSHHPRPPQQPAQPHQPRPPQAPKPAIASTQDHGDDDAAESAASTRVAGWAPRRDDRRPTWAITPEPIVKPAVLPEVVAAAAPAVVEVAVVAAAEPDVEGATTAAVTPVPVAVVMPADGTAPARKGAAPRKASVSTKPAAKAAPTKAAATKAAPAKRAAAKAAAARPPASAEPAAAATSAPAAPKKRARAVKSEAS